ncbi:ABC transporter substrate-binding protein [Allohahella sp. A8]|uniref:ABC transporter substrate-binding protein n=1 Tax=Allohahella sp. A8 TaxID=3141461 RepID=UPI003A7F63B8
MNKPLSRINRGGKPTAKPLRRTFLAAVTALTMALAVPAIADAKTLKLAWDADPVSLDPHEQLSGATLQLSHMVFDPLIRFDKKMAFEPRLAESFEQIDDKTMRFKLRKGVKFHSGNPFTAEDVKWTLNRLKESADFKAIFEQIAEAKIIDEHTVDLVAKTAFPLTLNTATYIFPMDSKFYSGKDEQGRDKAATAKHGDAYAARNVSGTGPYKVKSREQGVKTIFERNKDYWDTKSPGNIDTIVLTPIAEDPIRVAALLSGDVDFISPVPPNDLERIKQSDAAKLYTLSGTRIILFQLNQERVKAFADPRVRQAVTYAVNQEGIVKKIMKDFATPAEQLSPASYDGHNEALKPRFDIAKAKELMKEAGYEKGFKVSMIAPNNRYVNDEKIAQAVATMLSKINIDVDLKTMPKAQYWPAYDERSADIQMIGWHADTEDSNNFFEFLVACPDTKTGLGQYNSGQYCNKKVDEKIIQANTMTDMDKRAKLMQEIEQMLYDDAAFVPLHWQDLAWAAKPNVDAEPILNVMDFPYFGDLKIN